MSIDQTVFEIMADLSAGMLTVGALREHLLLLQTETRIEQIDRDLESTKQILKGEK